LLCFEWGVKLYSLTHAFLCPRGDSSHVTAPYKLSFIYQSPIV